MKAFKFFGITASLLLFAAACGENGVKPDTGKIDPKYEGLILNEIGALDNLDEVDSWVEIKNVSDETKSLDGLSLFITDEFFTGKNIASLSGSIPAGGRMVVSTADGTIITGISSAAPFTLVLGTDAKTAADSYENPEGAPVLGRFGSYQRIPDGSGEWRRLTYSSPGRENYVFNLEDYKPTAVWAWGSHLSDLIADDGAKMRNLKKLGYDHILMNYAGFENKNYRQQAIKFIQLSDEIGLVPHVWLQCFYDGGWVSPVDDANKCYKEEIFARIREDAKRYIEEWGVRGVHLDYIRFGGTAYKHNPSADVTAVGAVNRCCREIRETTDSFDEGLVTSAALMPEPNSSEYYGQIPSQMSKWIHILMPMIYRYGSYNFSDKSFQDRSNYYADQAKAGGGVSWSGIQTYDASTKGMSAEALRKDIDLMAGTRSAGVVLFRYQLGTYPDVNDLWNN